MEHNPKRHHKIPAAYLKSFEDDQGNVHTYDKLHDRVTSASAENTAVERYAYSFRDHGGARNSGFEDILARIENAGNPSLDTLRTTHRFEGYVHADFSLYVAAMYVRTDAFRQVYADTHFGLLQLLNHATASNDAAFDAAMKRYELDRGPLDTEHKDQLRDAMRDPSQFEISVDKDFTLAAFDLLKDLVPAFRMMSTILLINNSEVPFITSDNPVTLGLARPRHGRPLFSGGLLDPDNEVHFPLSPTVCWLGHHRRENGVVEVDQEYAAFVNHKVARNSTRYLYAPRQDAEIRALANRYKDHRPRMRLSHPGVSDVTLRRGR